MKASRYNVIVPASENGTVILYNTLAGSLARIRPEEARSVDCILEGLPGAAAARPDLFEQLVQQRFMVADDADELAVLVARRRAGVRDNNRLDLIVMPTLNCNFACPYCYEDHTPSSMSTKIRGALRAWMTREIPRHKVLLLIWFGGEPLLAYDDVIDLSNHARNIAKRSGVAFIGHITTNGYGLNPRRIGELINAEILDYQITLDGPPANHNRTRVLRSGRGTFDRVFGNVTRLVRADPRVVVSVRVNYNHQNLHSIPELLQLFPEDTRAQIGIELEPVFGSCDVSATDNLPAPLISAAIAEHIALAKRLGFRVYHGVNQVHTGKLVYCPAEREHQLMVNFNGDVFKCGVSRFRTEERVGYLAEDGTLMKVDSRWEAFVGDTPFEECCQSCAFLPLCMGGCRSARLHEGSTGSYCTLIPSNTTCLLKKMTLHGLSDDPVTCSQGMAVS